MTIDEKRLAEMSDRESRIDETARALFVGRCLNAGPSSELYVRMIATSAYAMATILEESRPVPDAATERPLAAGDRVRAVGKWREARGSVFAVHDAGRICVKCDGDFGSYIHGPASEWELEK